jgi:hypothetical protein
VVAPLRVYSYIIRHSLRCHLVDLHIHLNFISQFPYVNPNRRNTVIRQKTITLIYGCRVKIMRDSLQLFADSLQRNEKLFMKK